MTSTTTHRSSTPRELIDAQLVRYQQLELRIDQLNMYAALKNIGMSLTLLGLWYLTLEAVLNGAILLTCIYLLLIGLVFTFLRRNGRKVRRVRLEQNMLLEAVDLTMAEDAATTPMQLCEVMRVRTTDADAPKELALLVVRLPLTQGIYREVFPVVKSSQLFRHCSSHSGCVFFPDLAITPNETNAFPVSRLISSWGATAVVCGDYPELPMWSHKNLRHEAAYPGAPLRST